MPPGAINCEEPHMVASLEQFLRTLNNFMSGLFIWLILLNVYSLGHRAHFLFPFIQIIIYCTFYSAEAIFISYKRHTTVRSQFDMWLGWVWTSLQSWSDADHYCFELLCEWTQRLSFSGVYSMRTTQIKDP